DLLADMRRVSEGRLVVVELDPDRDATVADEALSLGIQPVQFNVIRADQIETRRGFFGLTLSDAENQRVMPLVEQTDDLEFRISAALAGFLTRDKHRVSFLSQYGAKSVRSFSGLTDNF